MNKTKDNQRASSMFDQALAERSEPVGVLRALKTACEKKQFAIKSNGAVMQPDETEWLTSVLTEAESACAAIRPLLANKRTGLIVKNLVRRQKLREQGV